MAYKLRSLRKSRGLTLDDVAQACGVSSQSVSRWETGQTNISDERFEQLATLYSCTADELKEYVSEDALGSYLKDKMQLSQDFDKIINRPLESMQGIVSSDHEFSRAQLILRIYEKISRLSDEGLVRIDERADTLLSMQGDE